MKEKFEAYEINYIQEDKKTRMGGGIYNGITLFPAGTTMEDALRLLRERAEMEGYDLIVGGISSATVRIFKNEVQEY